MKAYLRKNLRELKRSPKFLNLVAIENGHFENDDFKFNSIVVVLNITSPGSREKKVVHIWLDDRVPYAVAKCVNEDEYDRQH